MAALTALVFDDDEMTRKLLEEILNIRGVKVSSYADPAVFLQGHGQQCCARERPCFDLILTDNKMPMMTGLTFLEQLAAMGCPVLKAQTAVISGTWTSEDLGAARKLGCRVFEKPCPVDSILAWVDEMLPG
jgi:CheY-like chemotaxis protein